jgi:hypothetical protein
MNQPSGKDKKPQIRTIESSPFAWPLCPARSHDTPTRYPGMGTDREFTPTQVAHRQRVDSAARRAGIM